MARLGELLYMQLAQQPGDPVVDMLGAVVCMESFDLKGKRLDQRLQGGNQKRSEIASTAATNSYCVTSSTRLTSYNPLWPSRSPW